MTFGAPGTAAEFPFVIGAAGTGIRWVPLGPTTRGVAAAIVVGTAGRATGCAKGRPGAVGALAAGARLGAEGGGSPGLEAGGNGFNRDGAGAADGIGISEVAGAGACDSAGAAAGTASATGSATSFGLTAFILSISAALDLKADWTLSRSRRRSASSFFKRAISSA